MGDKRENPIGGDSLERQPFVAVPYEYLPFCNPEEDTIDLRDLWTVIVRRKWLILAVAVGAVAAAFAYIMLSMPAYEAKATIEIGHELRHGKGNGLVSMYFGDVNVLKHYLDTKYDTAGKYRKNGENAYISKISCPKKTGGFLTISAIGPDNEQAVHILSAPIEEIIARHQRYFEAVIQKKQDQIQHIRHQIEYDLNVELPRLKATLALLKNMQAKKIEDKIRLARTIDLKKIEEQIKLAESVDLKRIDQKIEFLNNEQIPTIEQKMKAIAQEITQKENDIEKMRHELSKLVEKDAAMATMIAMQTANLQNDISRLRIRMIDFQSEIKKIKEEGIPDLQKKKTALLKETIPNLKRQRVRILEQQIPDLEAEKKHLLEETIPTKQAEIKKMQDITIPNLKIKIKQIESSMKPPYLEMTRVVGRIYTHDYPVKPRKKLILALAVLTGLMLGIFLAFFWEFVKSKQ